jgi:hypothetical protein
LHIANAGDAFGTILSPAFRVSAVDGASQRNLAAADRDLNVGGVDNPVVRQAITDVPPNPIIRARVALWTAAIVAACLIDASAPLCILVASPGPNFVFGTVPPSALSIARISLIPATRPLASIFTAITAQISFAGAASRGRAVVSEAPLLGIRRWHLSNAAGSRQPAWFVSAVWTPLAIVFILPVALLLVIAAFQIALTMNASTLFFRHPSTFLIAPFLPRLPILRHPNLLC